MVHSKVEYNLFMYELYSGYSLDTFKKKKEID